jgi:hypothetical protein
MMIQTCFTAMLLLGIAGAVAAQQKPDFSGEWTLNRTASTLSRGADAVQSGSLRIEHSEPTFRCKGAFLGGQKPIEYEFELVSDGREKVAAQPGGRTVSLLRWDADALVFTSKVQRGGGAEITISFRYELVDGGRRLRAFEQLRGTDHDQDNVWIYDRR